MTDEQAFQAIADFIDGNQHAPARAALFALRKSLHSAQNRAEMACDQEPCGSCPGCMRAEELGGEPMADWSDS